MRFVRFALSGRPVQFGLKRTGRDLKVFCEVRAFVLLWFALSGRPVQFGLKVFCGARAFRFVVFDDSPDLTNCQIRQILTNPHYILCTKSPVICRIHFGKFVRALVNFSMRAGSA